MKDRNIDIEGVRNARDLGGLAGLDGRTVITGRLFRSGRLIRITDRGLDIFKELGITTVIDMRTSMEADKRPDPEIEGVTFIPIRVLDESPDAMGKTYGVLARSSNEDMTIISLLEQGFSMSGVYMDFVKQETAMKGMGEALHLIAIQPEDESILWHCNGGKDRTGTLSIFLYTILGVSREDMMDDFELSNEAFADEIARMKTLAMEHTDNERVIAEMQDIAGVSRSNMERALSYIEEEYGTVMDYIRDGLKVSDEDIERIRSKYLV